MSYYSAKITVINKTSVKSETCCEKVLESRQAQSGKCNTMYCPCLCNQLNLNKIKTLLCKKENRKGTQLPDFLLKLPVNNMYV